MTFARSAIARLVAVAVLAATFMVAFGVGSGAQADPGSPGIAPKAEAVGDGTASFSVTASQGDVNGGSVTIYQWQVDGESFGYYTDFWIANASLDVELPPGDYTAVYNESSGDFVSAHPNGADAIATVPTDPGAFRITADETTDVPFTLVPNPGTTTLRGTVTSATGLEFEGSVLVTTFEGSFVREVGIRADGTYSVFLPAGGYNVTFRDYSERHRDLVLQQVVGEDPVTLDAVLQPWGRAQVSGRIVDSSSQGIPNASVYLIRNHGGGSTESVAFVQADGEGNYTFVDVRLDEAEYTVMAQATGHQQRVLGGGVDPADATWFTLADTVAVPNLVLPRASRVFGVVSGPDGPAPNIRVSLMKWHQGMFFEASSFWTGDDGAYDFDSLDAGSYSLQFNAESSGSPLESAWLEGTEPPTSESAPGTFVIGDTREELQRDKALSRGVTASGTVRSPSGQPLEAASVLVYQWNPDGNYWDQFAETSTGPEGTFQVRVPRDRTVTVRISRGGFQPWFIGGGTTLPEAPTAENSVEVGDGGVPLGDVELTPRETKLGTVAGQRLDYCLDNIVPANDDGSSQAVEIPFDLKFFGAEHDTLFVNNNGNVTFESGLSQYTPSDLTGATGRPIIAAFFADVDTRGDSNVVTYGASPDGNVFCVNWADVGYYSSSTDKLNTFQMLLTRNDSGSGRVAGDFDITLNYDQVQWETGSASGGSGGLGGTSAAVGFSDGTGDPGTFVQLPGSLQNGALLDGGPNALVSGSQGSSQPGRYIFQVRNDGVEREIGNLQGRVVTEATEEPIGVGGAYVQVCRPNGANCSSTQTNATGHYSFTGLRAGDYRVTVWPPNGDLFAGAGDATVASGTTSDVAAIVLAAPRPIPPAVELTNLGVSSDGIPTVYYAEPLQFQVTGCPDVVNPSVTSRLSDGTVIHDAVPLVEAEPGVYRATLAQFYPNHGNAEITTNVPVTCGGDPVRFNIYIDPAGIVTDQYGRVIAGAEATLLRSDQENGTYDVVPDGSDIMSPSNRANPSITNADGYFRWDVVVGWYKVRAAFDGCEDATTNALEVPPERIDLVLKMTCTAAAPSPTTAPSLTGSGKVGTTLTAANAEWAAPLVGGGDLVWLRNGEVDPTITGNTHEVVAGDVGDEFAVRATAQRPDYVTDGGTEEDPDLVVSFDPVTATSPVTTAVRGDAPTATTVASVSGTGKVGTTLTGTDPTWSRAGVANARQWLRDGTPIAGATGTSYDVVAADLGKELTFRVTGTQAGYEDGVSAASRAAVLGDAPTATTAAGTTGSGKVGTSLTATDPVWSRPGVTNARQWLRDGEPIAGATGTTYALVAGDLGRQIAVRYTGTLAGHADGTSTSAPTTVLLGDAPSATTPVTLTDTARTDNTLTATAPVWSLPGTATTYQWFRETGPSSDEFAPIEGATGTTYAVLPTDVGRKIRVVATGTTDGHAAGSSTAERTALPGAASTATTPATIAGPGKVGTTLTGTDPAWSREGVANSRQWLRDGEPIAGATGTSYDVVAADLGKELALRVTGTLAGYDAGSSTSTSMTVVAGDAPVVSTKPSITGTLSVGRTLRARPGTWSGAPTFSYQWLRNGRTIAKATKSTYKLVGSDAGRKISVRIRTVKPGHLSATSTSSARSVAKVRTTTSLSVPSKVSARRAATVTVKVKASGISGPTGKVQVKDGRKVLKTVTLRSTHRGTVKIKLPKLKAGTHSLRAYYLGSSATGKSTSKVVKRRVSAR